MFVLPALFWAIFDVKTNRWLAVRIDGRVVN